MTTLMRPFTQATPVGCDVGKPLATLLATGLVLFRHSQSGVDQSSQRAAAWNFLSLGPVSLVSLRALTLALALIALPAQARESLGIFSTWAAFRDPQAPRCYAIAMAEPSTKQRDYQPFAAIGTWPRQGVRNQLHLRLSRRVAPNGRIVLSLGGQRFVLTGGGGDAWAADRRMDAAVVAAMRSAGTMTVSARDSANRGFSNTYALVGAATAMDAAAIGCARLR